MELSTGIVRPLYEDNHLLAIDKPAGFLAQGDKTKDRPIIEHAREYIKIKYTKPGNVFLGLVHRLDRPVSGVLLLARTSKALSRLNRMFARREVGKQYLAVVDTPPPMEEGMIRHWLTKDHRKNKVTWHPQEMKGSKVAKTRYQLITGMGPYCVVQITPETGRTHQIRAALSSIGSPIVGDVKYGGKPYDSSFIFLHCLSLSLHHPVGGKKLSITAPLPPDPMWQSVADLL